MLRRMDPPPFFCEFDVRCWRDSGTLTAPMRAISYCRAADFAKVAAAVGRALENDVQVSYADIEAADGGTGSLSAPGFLCAHPALSLSHELLLLRSAVLELTQELQATRERLWEREAELASVCQWVERLPESRRQLPNEPAARGVP